MTPGAYDSDTDSGPAAYDDDFRDTAYDEPPEPADAAYDDDLLVVRDGWGWGWGGPPRGWRRPRPRPRPPRRPWPPRRPRPTGSAGRGWRGGGGFRSGGRAFGGLRRELDMDPARENEMQDELLTLGGPSAPAGPMLTRDGWRLRLPHARVHTILSRLRPEQLRRLAGGGLGGDPGPAVSRAVRRLAARARRVGTFRERRWGRRYPVFAVRGYRILVRPLGETEGEILTVTPLVGRAGVAGELDEVTLPLTGRLSSRDRDQLRRAARDAYFQAYPRQRGRVIEIHHRVPLEWSHLFPRVDPNRLSNLQGLASQDHRRKASDLWDAFRATYQRRRQAPTATDVLRFAGVVDRSLNLPHPL